MKILFNTRITLTTSQSGKPAKKVTKNQKSKKITRHKTITTKMATIQNQRQTKRGTRVGSCMRKQYRISNAIKPVLEEDQNG